MIDKIFIFGAELDPHVELVRQHFHEETISCEVLDCYKQSNDCLISLQKIIEDSKCRSFWWRLKDPISERVTNLGLEEKLFLINEWKHYLRSFEYHFEKALWVNKPSLIEKFSLKPFQIHLSQKYGLLTPKTIFTNDPHEVTEFLKGTERTVYKPFRIFTRDKQPVATFTTEITKDIINLQKSSVIVAPSIYQEYIPKKYELRVTVVGNQIFTAKIDSQNVRGAEIDWRKNQKLEMFSAFELNVDMKEKILKFHKDSGLVYGAYDFIVSNENGQIYFLEVNPEGQWAWLDDLFDKGISKSIANILANGHV